MRSRRSLVVLVSILAHAGVLVAIFVASLMATGTLPTPFHPLALGIDRTVRLVDIALPAPQIPRRPTRSRTGPAPLARAIAATPIEAPAAVAPDTSSEVARGDGLTVPGDAPGADALQSVGILETPPALSPRSPGPQAPVRASSGLVAPKKTFNVDPVYPNVARLARVEGLVILEAIVDRAGRVESARVLRSIPLLDQAALDAVRQWRFTPTLLNGVAVPMVVTVTVTFRLAP